MPLTNTDAILWYNVGHCRNSVLLRGYFSATSSNQPNDKHRRPNYGNFR